MTGGVADLDDAAGDVRGQPLAVRWRDEDVGQPVADEDRHGDVRNVEPPRLQHREVVVDPAVDTVHRPLERRLADDLHRFRAGQLRSIRLAHVEVLEDRGRVDTDAFLDLLLQRLELGSEDVFAGERPAELLDVLRIHAGKPGFLLQPGRSERRNTDLADRADDPIGQERRAREHVRSSARTSGGAELIEAELSSQARARRRPRRPRDGRGFDRTSRTPRDRASRSRRRARRTAPRVPTGRATAWRAVQREDRESVRIAPDRERERPTIGCLERPQRLAHRVEHTTKLSRGGGRRLPERPRARARARRARPARPLRAGLDDVRTPTPTPRRARSDSSTSSASSSTSSRSSGSRPSSPSTGSSTARCRATRTRRRSASSRTSTSRPT